MASTYVSVVHDTKPLDFQWILEGMCMMEHDLPHNIQHWFHKHLDMDLHIFGLRKLWFWGNRCWEHIRDDIQYRDLPYIRECNCKNRHHFVPYKRHLCRMGSDCKALEFRSELGRLEKERVEWRLKYARKFETHQVISIFFLLGIGWHPVKGSPVYWSWHLQIGWWPVTLQLV